MLTGCRSWGWGVLNFKVLELIRGKYYEDYHRLWDIILQIKIGEEREMIHLAPFYYILIFSHFDKSIVNVLE